jgi:predicted permease
LLIQPLVTFGFCILFGLSGLALIVPVIFAALPTSSTSYVVSRRMGSDAQLMAAIVTATHLAAIITLPIIILAIT